jgi:hypothetical protein
MYEKKEPIRIQQTAKDALSFILFLFFLLEKFKSEHPVSKKKYISAMMNQQKPCWTKCETAFKMSVNISDNY